MTGGVTTTDGSRAGQPGRDRAGVVEQPDAPARAARVGAGGVRRDREVGGPGSPSVADRAAPPARAAACGPGARRRSRSCRPATSPSARTAKSAALSGSSTCTMLPSGSMSVESGPPAQHTSFRPSPSASTASSSGPPGGNFVATGQPASAQVRCAATCIVGGGVVEEVEPPVRPRPGVRDEVREGRVRQRRVVAQEPRVEGRAEQVGRAGVAQVRQPVALEHRDAVAVVVRVEAVVGVDAQRGRVRDHALVQVPDEDAAARQQRVVLVAVRALRPEDDVGERVLVQLDRVGRAPGSGSRAAGTRRSTASPAARRGCARTSAMAIGPAP